MPPLGDGAGRRLNRKSLRRAAIRRPAQTTTNSFAISQYRPAIGSNESPVSVVGDIDAYFISIPCSARMSLKTTDIA
jgi:hypothetical protein